MNIGIVVEGPSDKATYPILLRRIRNDIGELQSRDCGGKSRLKRAFVGYLKEFNRNHAWNINTALVIRDSDCKPPHIIEEELGGLLDDPGFGRTFRVEFFATKCQLETWLIADENAINQIASLRGERKLVGPAQFQFETDNRAKQFFLAQLSSVNLPSTTAIYKEIADRMDFDRVASRCANFQRFIDKIRAL
jgi:hypothetical protein